MDKYDTGETRICRQLSSERTTDAPLQPSSHFGDRDVFEGLTLDDRFKIIGPLGRGGMSAVFKAEHLLLQRTVAVKILHRQLCADPRSLQRFQAEARALSALNHPNIVKIYAFGITQNQQAYLVMDYLEAQTLSDVLVERGHLRPHEAMAIGSAICQGLKHVHQNGLVHRDLKPANIMLSDPADVTSVKIVDFGIVWSSQAKNGRLTEPGGTCGSPAYMSPEQCLGDHVDTRSDIYSLGCILYEMLTGLKPFSGSSAADTMLKQVHEDPVPFGELRLQACIPSALEAIVFRCLNKNKEERYASIDLLMIDLDHVGSSNYQEEELRAGLAKRSKCSKSNLVLPSLACIGLVAAVLTAVTIFFYLTPQGCVLRLQGELNACRGRKEPSFFVELSRKMLDLSDAYEACGNKPDALRVLRECSESGRRILHEDTREYAELLFELSLRYRAQGQEQQAADAAKQSIATMLKVALACDRRQDASGQERALLDCIEMCHKTGQPPPERAAHLYALSVLYKRQNRLVEAEQAARAILDISLAAPSGKQGQLSILFANHNLAEIYLAQGAVEQALPLFVANERLARQIHGEGSDTHEEALRRLANCYQHMNRLDEAEMVLAKIRAK